MSHTRKTLLLTVTDIQRLVKAVGLTPLMAQITDRIESDFKRWSEFTKSPRTANYSTDGVIELMPVSDSMHFGFKYVNGHPKNPMIGLPTVMAFGCLAEVATGWPLLVCEMTLLTAIRTACTSVVAGRALAIPGPRLMAMIGNGAQSEFQVIAFSQLLGVDTVNLYDIDIAATRRVMDNLAKVPGLKLVAANSAVDAVKGANVVTTSTASKVVASVLRPDMVEPGMHINAIGGDCPGKTEIDPHVLEMSKVFVEYEPQTRVEGDIQQMPASFPVTELWQVLAGANVGRTSAEEITLFDSVGFSVEDFSTLNVVHELAIQHGLGAEVELIPDLADVKNLFALIR